jgi:hypothetical protein
MVNKSQLLEVLKKHLKDDVAASYFIGRYYFSVNTRKSRMDFGLVSGTPITYEIQKQMQLSNAVPLLHEYIHYIHEISTVVGNIGLGMDVALKSIFSNYFDKDLKSSLHAGLDIADTEKFDIFCKIFATKEVLNGNVEQGKKLLRVKNYRYKMQPVYALEGTSLTEIKIEVPIVTIETFGVGKFIDKEFTFGKFFIYEGLAYELDRIIDQQWRNLEQIHDDSKGTEYTVLRNVAKFIMPDIDTNTFLVAASLSLSYIDPGRSFIEMICRIKKAKEEGLLVTHVLATIKNEVSAMLLSKLDVFNEAQDEIVEVFKRRNRLHKAFSVITQQAKNAYLAKCEQPSFEVDFIFAGKYEKLMNIVPPCDYMYVFRDVDEFNRDFLGTASFDDDSSQALKVLIGYDHYQKSHELINTLQVEAAQTVKCPFYTCCNLQLRLDHSDICASRPWRIFEISTGIDRQYCWYGQAVGEFKGHNQ